jgi:hypothetical protein
MVFFASASAPALSPEFQAGWPQQVWVSGTITSQPAVSSSFRAAKPMLGRIRSTRQVTNRSDALVCQGLSPYVVVVPGLQSTRRGAVRA